MRLSTPYQRCLLLLLAMGNWANSPSPPNDPHAPRAVGNEGVLEFENLRRRYAVHEARLEQNRLLVLGEELEGRPEFTMTATLESSLEQPTAEGLRGQRLVLSEGRWGQREQTLTAEAGSLELLSATGRGPWEIDAELEFRDGAGQTYRAQLRTRVSL